MGRGIAPAGTLWSEYQVSNCMYSTHHLGILNARSTLNSTFKTDAPSSRGTVASISANRACVGVVQLFERYVRANASRLGLRKAVT